MTKVRKGQAPDKLSREEFSAHYRKSFFDPAFDAEQDALARIEEIAWQAYKDARKSPRTSKAGPGFADPDYDLSDEWRETHDKLQQAVLLQKDEKFPSRVLLISGSGRNDGTCPGEAAKSWRL